MKNFKIKKRIIKSLMEEEIPSVYSFIFTFIEQEKESDSTFTEKTRIKVNTTIIHIPFTKQE